MSSDLRSDGIELALPASPVRARVVTGSSGEYVVRRRRAEVDEAYARGCADGMRTAVEAAAGALASAADRLDAAREAAQPELATTAVELAIEIARAIVRAEIEQGHHDVESIVRDTLATSGVGRGKCVVHVNPLDAERLKHVAFRAGTQIEPDPEVPAGDVHITTPHGVLVRDADEMLAAIRERLRTEIAR